MNLSYLQKETVIARLLQGLKSFLHQPKSNLIKKRNNCFSKQKNYIKKPLIKRTIALL